MKKLSILKIFMFYKFKKINCKVIEKEINKSRYTVPATISNKSYIIQVKMVTIDSQ